ncbi:MAG: PH domain-containing protein [Patescibacteria group bacterium]|jgi:hypothetical protein
MKEDNLKITEIRKAYYPLIVKIILLSFLFDVVLFIVFIILLSLTSDRVVLFYLFLILIAAKLAVLSVIAIKMTFAWTFIFYHIEDNRLIQYRGFYNPEEVIFNLNNLYSIDAYSSYLGRVLKYGDLSLTFINNVNNEKDIIQIWGIVEPFQYKKYFQQFLK